MLRRTLKMLVADDAVVVRELFREAAERATAPIKVVFAVDGHECMVLLGNGDIGLAFIDVHMPGMSGIEALWGARHQGIKTFVTLMSGRPSEEFIEVAQKLKAYEFLAKPFSVDDVLAVIRTYERIAAPTQALVVDDSATVRRIIHKVLAASIFQVNVEDAADGQAALGRCAEGGIDIVFLDCNMPGLDGFATLSRLLARNPQMKVVMMSAERTEGRERAALDRGAVAFLHKPFYSVDVDSLLHTLHGLRSPNLITRGTDIKGFDVEVQGRVVTVRHTPSGHGFQYVWYRDPPYLRSTRICANPAVGVVPGDIRADAERAAVRELKRADLVCEALAPQPGRTGLAQRGPALAAQMSQQAAY